MGYYFAKIPRSPILYYPIKKDFLNTTILTPIKQRLDHDWVKWIAY